MCIRDSLYEASHTPLIGFLNNAIKAKELFKRDRDYIVRNREVLIVDEHTGRVMEGRRYNEGMHQAIEAKEQMCIRDSYETDQNPQRLKQHAPSHRKEKTLTK